MIESFKIFANDYKVLMECNKTFVKKHWKGVIVLNCAIYTGFLIGWYGAEELRRSSQEEDW